MQKSIINAGMENDTGKEKLKVPENFEMPKFIRQIDLSGNMI